MMIMESTTGRKIYPIALLLKITAALNLFWLAGALIYKLIIVPSMEEGGLSVCFDSFPLQLQSLIEVAFIVSIIALSRRRRYLLLSAGALGYILCLYGWWLFRSLAISGYLPYQFTDSEIRCYADCSGSGSAIFYGGSWWNTLVLLNTAVAFGWHLWWLYKERRLDRVGFASLRKVMQF